MCRINNRDKCLKEFETDFRQRKYKKKSYVYFSYSELLIQEPTRSTYYRFYKLNRSFALCERWIFLKFSNEQSRITKVGVR